MKKIFLSLAAMAFLAVGTVSCSSSDDSGNGTENGGGNNGGGNNGGGNNGGGNNGGEETEAAGLFVYDDEAYYLDNSFSLVGANADESIKIYDIEFTDGTTERATRWDLVAFSGDDADASLNYHQFRFYIPVGENDAIVRPNEMETFIPVGALVYAGSATTNLPLGTLSAYQFGVNTFVQGYAPDFGSASWGVNFTSSLAGEIQMAYEGTMDGAYLEEDEATQRPSAKGRKISMGDISKLNKVEGGKVYVNAKPVLVK